MNESGYREILGICEGAKEDKSGWSAFLKHLKERGLKGNYVTKAKPTARQPRGCSDCRHPNAETSTSISALGGFN